MKNYAVNTMSVAFMNAGIGNPYKTKDELLTDYYDGLVKSTFNVDVNDKSIIEVLNDFIGTYSDSEVRLDSKVKTVEITSYALFNYLRIKDCEEELKHCWIAGKIAYVNIDSFFRMFIRAKAIDTSVRIQIIDTKLRQGIQKINLISLNDLV